LSAYVLLVIVAAVLWLFWAALGELFDWISEEQRKADRRVEDSSAN